MKLASLFAFSVFLLAGCFPLPLQTTDRTVAEGKLVCRDLTTPVADADVELSDLTTARSNFAKTDADGFFRIEIPSIRRTVAWYPLAPVDYAGEKRFRLVASTASSKVTQWIALRNTAVNDHEIQFGTIALQDCPAGRR